MDVYISVSEENAFCYKRGAMCTAPSVRRRHSVCCTQCSCESRLHLDEILISVILYIYVYMFPFYIFHVEEVNSYHFESFYKFVDTNVDKVILSKPIQSPLRALR